MNNIVRAWKDETNRQGLSVEEQVVLPANLVGEIDLTDEELEAVYGAWSDDGFEDISNVNRNTATSSSTSAATGGTATAFTGEISVPLVTV